MADKNLTTKIFDNIAAGFADVQKDISEAKKAIEAAGIPSSGTTKNLSEEIAKIQTKVTDDIKESGNIEGFGGGTMDIKDGFIIRKVHYNSMNENTTEPLTNNIDYKVPDDMSYELTWPTNEAMKKDIADFRNLRYNEDPKIQEKYSNYNRPLVRLHFQKNNTGRLANTGQYVNLKPYKPSTGGDGIDEPQYDLEIRLTDDTISTADTVSQSLIDTYKLNNSEVTTTDTVIKYTGESVMSLPLYDSKFVINGNDVQDSIIVTDNFVAGIHPKIKATICKKIILHNDNLIIGRLKGWRDYRNMSTKCIDIYIDKDTEALEVDTDNLRQYITKQPTMKYALIGPTSRHTMINILVNKSDKMTASIRAVALKLAPMCIRVYNYDRSEYYDFNKMKWEPTAGVSDFISWPRYLSDRNVDVNTIFYYNGWETDRYTLVNRFGLDDNGSNGLSLDMSYIREISQLQDIVDKAKDGYIYQVGRGEYLTKNNTITLNSPDFTWKTSKRLGMTSSSFPKMVYNYFSIPEIDGVKTVTLDLSRMPGATYGSQEFPLIGLEPENGQVMCRVVLAGKNGSNLADTDFELLAAPGNTKFLDRNKTPITTVTVDRSSVSDDKYIIPIFYNKFITEVDLTGCTIGKVTGSNNGVFVTAYYDNTKPTTPMIFKLHNCKYGDVYSGSAKDRNPEISPLGSRQAEENAKYVRFLIDESDPILQDDDVLRLRLSFYNMDQTKKYNWSKRVWEALDALTPDNKEYRYIANPHLEEEEEAARRAEEEAARRAEEESAMNSSEEENTDTGEPTSEDTTEETHSEDERPADVL